METRGTVQVIDDEVGRLREELETANRKLTEAHKMASIGRLSAGIVHEINTPIGSIFSNNEVTVRSLEKARALLSDAKQNGSAPPDKALALIDSILSLTAVDKMACERISGIIRSLKTFARVSEHDLRKVELHELIDELSDEEVDAAFDALQSVRSGRFVRREATSGELTRSLPKSGPIGEMGEPQVISPRAGTPEERIKAFRRWVNSRPTTERLLTDEDVSRMSFYGERG